MENLQVNTPTNDYAYNPLDTYNRIIEIFEKNGKSTSQTAIGDYFGFGQGTISNWKNNFPGMDTLIKICSEFHVSLDWLVFGKEIITNKPTATQKEPDPVKPVQIEKDIEDYTVTDICKAIVALSRFENVTIENGSLYSDYYENDPFYDYKYYPSSITITITPKTYLIQKDEGPGFDDAWGVYREHNYRDIYVTYQDAPTLEIFLTSLKNTYNMPLSDAAKKMQLEIMLSETIKMDKRIKDNQFFLPTEYKDCGLCFRDASFTSVTFDREKVYSISKWPGPPHKK